MVTSSMVELVAPGQECGSLESEISGQILKVLANKDKCGLGGQLPLRMME